MAEPVFDFAEFPTSAFESYETGLPLPTLFFSVRSENGVGHIYLTIEGKKLQTRNAMATPARSGVFTALHAHVMAYAKQHGYEFLSERKDKMTAVALKFAEKLHAQGLSEDLGSCFRYSY